MSSPSPKHFKKYLFGLLLSPKSGPSKDNNNFVVVLGTSSY